MFGWAKRATPSAMDVSASGTSTPSKKDGRNAREEEVQEVSLVGKVQNSDSAVVVILGGTDLQEPENTAAGQSMYVFKPQLNQWLAIEPMPEPRSYHAVVYYAGCIYVLGGCRPAVASKGGPARAQRSVFKFHVREKRWDRAADMLHARACHGAAVVYEKIMVVGGKDDKEEILNSVELYNPALDSWIPYRHLPLPLMACGVAFLGGMVYVVGGVTTKKQVFSGMAPAEVLSTVHATDPNERTWVRRPSLPEPRAYCTALTIHHELWLAGGLKPSGRDPTSFTNLIDVLAFDYRRGRWEFRFKLSRARHAVAAAKADDRVYVIGGMTCLDGTSVDDVDVYHRQRLCFLDCQCLPRKLTGLAAVTVPPDSSDESGLKSGTSSRAPSSLQLDQGDQDKKRRPHKPPKNSYADKDRSTEEIEVPPQVRTKLTPRPRPRTDAGDVEDSGEGGHWPPSRLSLDSKTFLGVETLKLRTPLSRPSLPRFYHYVPTAPANDPHSGITVRVDDDFKRTKEVLGLRDASGLPSFARKLRRVKKVQDETLPVILTFGGLDPRDPLNYANGRVVLHYHVLKNRWDLCGMMPEPRSYHAAVLIGKTVYITGGFDPETRKCGELVACKTTFAYDIDAMEWSRKADMKTGRAAHGVAAFKNKLLVFGGRGRFGRAVASTEEYDPSSNTWRECTPLDVPRMAVGCATVADVIYVVGGMIPEEDDLYRVVDRVDIYDPKTHTWSEGPPLPKPRAFPAAASLGDKLWLIGGCYDNSEPGLNLVSLRDVDVLEPSGWVHMGCTTHSRHAAAVAAADTNIYVIGGTSSVLNGPIKRPEVYLQQDDRYKFPAEYPEAMTGISAVSVPPVTPTFRSRSLTCMITDALAE